MSRPKITQAPATPTVNAVELDPVTKQQQQQDFAKQTQQLQTNTLFGGVTNTPTDTNTKTERKRSKLLGLYN